MAESAELSKKFTRELAKNLTKFSNKTSKLRENFIHLNHSPNNLILSKNIKQPFSYTLTPKTPQISAFMSTPKHHEFIDSRCIHKKDRLDPFQSYEQDFDFEQKAFNTSSKKVYQIGSLSIEKSSKCKDDNNKENLIFEMKSLNEKFNLILSKDQKITENSSESNILKEEEINRKKLGDRTNSICKKNRISSYTAELDREIKMFKNFDGLEFEEQRNKLEKHNLQKKLEVSSLAREITQQNSQLEATKKELDEVTTKLREKKSEYQRISIEFDIHFQQYELKQKQIDISKQHENIRVEQEKSDIEQTRKNLSQLQNQLKERETIIIAKEKENIMILKQIESQLQNLDLRKNEVSENLKKCYEFETDFKLRNEKLQEKDKILNEEKKAIDERAKLLDGQAFELMRKEKEISTENEKISEKLKDIEQYERNIKKITVENNEKDIYLQRKEKELCKVIEEIKTFSSNLKNEKIQQEKRLKSWEDILKRKEDELNMKEKLLIEKNCKDEDLELKLLGLKMNEDTFKKKLDIEIRNYKFELQKLVNKEKDLILREKKIAELERREKKQLGNGNNKNNEHNTNNTVQELNMLSVPSKKILKNELEKIFNQDKKAHRLQKSQSFFVLRKQLNNLGE